MVRFKDALFAIALEVWINSLLFNYYKMLIEILKLNTILELSNLYQRFISLYFCSLWPRPSHGLSFCLPLVWRLEGDINLCMCLCVCVCCKGNHS